MRRIVFMIVLVLLLVFLTACAASQLQGDVAALPDTSSVQEEVKTGGCPRGIHDDAYPGLCPLYVDKNENNECDLGE